jgi:hypothetical protein
LPECERVDHDDICRANDGVSGAIRKLVPAVRSADLDACGQARLDSLDLALEFLACEVSAVERLGADGDGVDLAGVLLRNIGDCFEILVEGLLNIRPRRIDQYCYRNST